MLLEPPEPPALGHALLTHFSFADGYRNLNHGLRLPMGSTIQLIFRHAGSFGTHPKSVRDVVRRFQDLVEARPDPFLRRECHGYLNSARKAIAKIVNADANNCVYVPNATSGFNTVLRNLVFQKGDVVVYFSTTYGACEKTIQSMLETNANMGAHRIEFLSTWNHEEVVTALSEAVAKLRGQGLNPCVAVFDTVSSGPGLRFPYERLTLECRKLRILSMIDGAHGVGCVPLDLSALDPDFLITNLHKLVRASRHTPPWLTI